MKNVNFALRHNALLYRQTPAVFLKETFPISLGSLQPVPFLNVTRLIFRAFINRFISSEGQFIIPVSSQTPFSSVFLCSARNVYFDARIRCMLLYVDIYSGQKCGVFIIPQNVHTGRPPNALPPATQSYTIALLYTEYFRCVALSASCTELQLMAPSIAAVSYFVVCCLVDQFQLHFLHRIPCFLLKAEPQFLTGIFLNSEPSLYI